ncbi:MAG: NAD-dependent epimerase/dehydratase family protein [Deltaproteobacteria bacterium]|nr:NAD-dependent epimerase/dehydratase family protein [Deltaproteobacteria bacterium]
MKVLIVGGTGLISTAITNTLQQRGIEVTHFNRGKSQVRVPAGMPRPQVIVGDRKDFPAFERQMAQAGRFDAVIDMVAYLPEEVESAVRAFRGRVGQYIFCSTVDAYVKPYVRFPITENHPIGGLTAYGKAKARCEDVLMAAHTREFPVTIIRPAMTFGEGGHMIDLFVWNSRFLDRIARGMPIISHGDGQSLWGALYINDIAGPFANAVGNYKAFGRAYHVTADEVQTWDQYFAGCAQAIGVPVPELVHIPTSLLVRALPKAARECAENFQFDNVFDNSAAKEDLGFRQTVSFVEAVRRTYQWLVENKKLQRNEENPLYDEILAAWRPLADQFTHSLSGNDA